MPRLANFQEFVLKFTSPWNLPPKTSEGWTQSFYVTGTITHTDTEAETAALALAGPALALASSNTSLTGFTYYPSHSQVSTVNKTYTAGAHPGTGSGYSAGTADPQQLEVCIVAHCPTAKNTRGKQIYLRKYLHDVTASASDPNSHQAIQNPSTLLAPWNTGAGPHLVRPCSPRTGDTGSTWSFETHLFTHQLRKGKKRKAATQAALDRITNELLDLGLNPGDAAKAAAAFLLKRIG